MSATTSYVEPKGISGWLILPAIGAALGPFAILRGLAESVDLLDQVDQGTSLHTAIVIEGIVNFGLLLFAIWNAIVFFRKKRSAPSVFIALITLGLVVGLADAAMVALIFGVGLDPQTTASLAVSLVTAAIWIPYFGRSRRVRNTFVN